MELYLLIIIIALLTGILLILLFRKDKQKDNGNEALTREIARLDGLVRDEFSRNREEASKLQKESRSEQSESLTRFSEVLASSDRELKEELARSLKAFQDSFSESVKSFNDLQRQKFDELNLKQAEQKTGMEIQLEKIRDSVEKSIDKIREENTKKLDEMRATVDEKLHATLEKRLSESFKMVSERLEQVHKGLGEMQTLASDVGDLKKVLTNVKQRGVLGEIQLGAILENILSPGQYAKNVKTKKDTSEHVEYAIILPGKDDSGNPVYLPVDSKFPMEDYLRLVEAYQEANAADIKSSTSQLQQAIKKSAKEIHDKYIDPPQTTDFGILFLPVEGLYAEVVRQPGLIEDLSRNFKIIIAGPTTLAALLNSLQMGFRTLAIEKRSSEVWKVLQAVKTEFGNFEKVLLSAKQKIDKAGEDIDKLVGTRTRKIQVKLRSITELPEDEARNVLGEGNDEEIVDTEE
jgi:DNA recombination protein RmuC